MRDIVIRFLATATLIGCFGLDRATAQTNTFSIQPAEHEHKAQCPGVEFVYKIQPRNTCYSVDILGTEGMPAIENITEGGVNKWKITLKWKDDAVYGSIKLKRDTAASCKNQQPVEKEFLIPILSVNGKKPSIVGDFSIVAGKKVEVEYEANLDYIPYGDQDPIPFEVDHFEWKKPTGWNFIGTNPNAKVVKFLTNECGEGDVEVRGRSKCGKWSDWEKLPVSRYAQAPCPLSSTASYVICEDKTAISCTAKPDNTLTGYTYEWEKPATWTWEVVPGSGSTAVSVRPDGLSGGIVRVRAVACGKKSAWCSVNLPLMKIHPNTKILGTDTLCSEGYQALSITPPPSSTINWTITPSAPFAPNHIGQGDFANLVLNNGTFGDAVTITFDISTLCGDTTIAKTFFAGKPKIYNQQIDGVSGTSAFICPGMHWVAAKTLGASSACFTWEVYGNNPVFTSCQTADVFMTGYSGATTLNANVENVCGTNDIWFFLMPKNYGCEWHWSLNVYPNPATDILNVQITGEEGMEMPKMEWIKLINDKGIVVREMTTDIDQAQLSLLGLPGGLYIVMASVEGIVVNHNADCEKKPRKSSPNRTHPPMIRRGSPHHAEISKPRTPALALHPALERQNIEKRGFYPLDQV